MLLQLSHSSPLTPLHPQSYLLYGYENNKGSFSWNRQCLKKFKADYLDTIIHVYSP